MTVPWLILVCRVQGDEEQGVTEAVQTEAGEIPAEAETEQTETAEEYDIGELWDILDTNISEYPGDWSVYIKVIRTEDEILMNELPMTSASLIKLFVMAKTFRDREAVEDRLKNRMGEDASPEKAAERLDRLLWNMIAASDNESFNELVRLQTEDYDFAEGAKAVDRYLLAEGYTDTSVQSSLSPSESEPVSLGGNNHTTVRDCGLLLDRIYWGECVDQQTSQQMLNLLFAQETDYKIPAALPDQIPAANKTGETDENQHDAAIIFGKKTNYILCIMSQNCPENEAIDHIRELSAVVYDFLNAEN